MKSSRFSVVLFAACALLSASCATKYKEWRGGSIQRGAGGAVERISGVDVWSMGRPNRSYQVIGIIEDSRPGAVVPMATRAGAVAREAKKRGGDGVIILSERKEYRGTIHNRNAFSTLNATTNYNATTDLYGSTAYTRGTANTTGTMNTFGSGVSMPVFRAYGQYQVIRYVDDASGQPTKPNATGSPARLRSDASGTVYAE